MTLIFLESFDAVDQDTLSGKWVDVALPTGAISTGFGRTDKGVKMQGGTHDLRRILTSAEQDDVIVVGFALKFPGPMPSPDQQVLRLAADVDATTHGTLLCDSNGSLVYRRGSFVGTVLGTTAVNTMLEGTFHYIELKVKLNDTTGTVDIHVDGTSRLALTSQDTKNAGTATVFDNVEFQPNRANANFYLDDIYILNEQGTVNNTFVGDCRVRALLPNGNGASSQFTGSDADSIDNYLLVDETTIDGDTTYVESSTVGNKDTYNFTDLTETTGTVHGVQAFVRARKTDIDVREFAIVARHSVTETDSATKTLADTYGWFGHIYENVPGGTGWTITQVNDGQWGHKVVT